MNEKLAKEIKFLRIYSVVITLAVFLLFYLTLKTDNTSHMEELTVERINIVEKNGDLKLVISNSEKQHSGLMQGKELAKRKRAAGLIFFNSDGDECGGLVYDGNEKNAGMVLSIDKFREDQVMQLQYIEDVKNKNRKYGIQLWDYPKENGWEERYRRGNELNKLTKKEEIRDGYTKLKQDSLLPDDRLFLGKTFNKDVGLFLYDKNSRPRIKIYIDNNNNPKFEFLDTEGNVIDGKPKAVSVNL